MVRKTWMDATIKAALIGAAVLMYLDLKAEIRSVRVDLGNRIDRVETEIRTIRADLEAKIGTVRADLGNRIDRVESRIDRVESRIDRIESKIDKVVSNIDRVESKVDEVRGYLEFEITVPNGN